jgi:hypothetical protein
MATLASLVTRVRHELGDFEQTFRHNARADGVMTDFDLPATNISRVAVTKVFGGEVVVLDPADYAVNKAEGTVIFGQAPEDSAVLLFEGAGAGLFSDEDLSHYIHDAFIQHTHGATQTMRYKTAEGFIRYAEEPVSLETLPEVEELLVALLATVEALWALSTDASTDIDIQSPEGTSIPRSQRFAQIRHQIDVLTEKYTDLCQQLNVGLHRIEVGTLRRVSRTTGRYVPVFAAREYDDHSLPTRELPPIDKNHVDESGIPSPAYGGWGGF